jgi:hypothetical protein
LKIAIAALVNVRDKSRRAQKDLRETVFVFLNSAEHLIQSPVFLSPSSPSWVPDLIQLDQSNREQNIPVQWIQSMSQASLERRSLAEGIFAIILDLRW